VTRGRHSLAPQKSRNRRLTYLAAPLVTSAVVGIGVVASGGAPKQLDLSRYADSDLSAAAAPAPTDRVVGISRDTDRQVVAALIDPKVTGRMWTTVDLDLRATPDADARVLGEVKAVTRVRVTGERSAGFAQVIQRHGGARTVAWVNADYLVPKKPADPAHLGLSDAPCPDGSVERGLTAGAVHLYRSVCHAFPQITQYGGWDAHGEHSSGKALDIMTSDVQLGNAIAAFLQAHSAELNIFDILWQHRIWTTQRASDGWRTFADRGSPTANHMDHVHVSVY